MDTTAIYKLSYGVFFLGTEFEGNKNICVINTAVQQTAEPLIISITVLKTNYTADLILKSKKFSIGVMGQNIKLEDVAHFGQQSGRDLNKLATKDYETDILNNPIYLKGCIASLSATVTDVIDLPTHYLFIAKIEDAKNISDDNPLTYAQYRQLKAGGTINNDAKETAKTWQCGICHYIYDGDTPFEDLPDDYVCPVCGRPKKFFEQV